MGTFVWGPTESFVEGVRRRPGLFVGDTGPYARGHLISYAVDLIAEGARGRGDRLEIETEGPMARLRSTITPGDVDALFAALETGTIDEQSARNETWQLLVVSALSRQFRFEAGGRCFEASRGVGHVTPCAHVPGFRAEFELDEQIFISGASLDARFGLKRARDLAFVLPGLTTSFVDRASGRAGTWHAPGGMTDLVEELTADYRQPTWGFIGVWGEVAIDAAVHFERFEVLDFVPMVAASFANTVPTRGGGAHARGLRGAIEAAAQGGDAFSKYTWVGAISVRMPRQRLKFDGPTKDILGVPGLEAGLIETLTPSLREHMLRTGVLME